MSIALCFFSCVRLKDITFFQSHQNEVKKSVNPSDTIPVLADSIKISTGDILAIYIKTESTALQGLINGTATAPSSTSGPFFAVDNKGAINLPYIGDLKVSDLTISQVRKLLKEKLSNYLVDPYIEVNLQSFFVIVLGEVLKQGGVNLDIHNATIVDAISSAGGLTDHGNAQEVEIIRGEHSNPQVIYFDLTQLSSFKKPGFYLKPHDIVYVKPRRSKSALINITRATAIISFLTIFNTVIIVLTFFKK